MCMDWESKLRSRMATSIISMHKFFKHTLTTIAYILHATTMPVACILNVDQGTLHPRTWLERKSRSSS
jgi:hypothetical protein